VNLKSPLRRTATIAAGVLVGLTGVVALAGPASAHHPIIVGGTSCVNDDGTWQVTWQVTNSEDDLAGKITAVELTPAGSTLTGIAVGAELPIAGQGVLEGVQALGADDTVASIAVGAEWQRPNRTVTSSRKSDEVKKSDEKCNPTPPTSPSPTPPSPAASESTPPAPEEPSTPASTEPSTSASASTPPEEPTTEPEFVYEETCETITVGITVPADWPEDITVVFKTSEGDSKTVVGKVGETTTVEFPAVDGMTITATPEGYEGEGVTITYEAPADCDTGGSGGSDDEPSLPLTGAAAGSIAGGAGALLAVGAGLFFMARRRKVKFTA